MDPVSIENEASSSNIVEMITTLSSTPYQNINGEINILGSSPNQTSNVELGSTSNQNNDVVINVLGSTSKQNNDVEIVNLSSISNQNNDNFDRLLEAAADGNIEPFKKMARQLHLVVTPLKNTALHINITSEKTSVKFVKEMLKLCPSLLTQVNAQGDTPLLAAAKFQRYAVVRALIKKAKEQRENLENGIGVTKQMLRMTNNKGNTALHEAMRNSSVRIVRTLVKEDPTFLYPANNCGETPLYIAAETAFYYGAVEILAACTSVAHEGPHGKTALHAAAAMSLPGLTKIIFEKKKSLTKEVDEYGWTPLHYAAYYGHVRIIGILLKFDKSAAYIADKSRKMTPLHLAASQGYYNIVWDIIFQCPDCYELVDDRGWNVLHFAMASLSENKVSSLLKIPLIKKLVYEKDAKGNTPLHVLACCPKSWNSRDQFHRIIEEVRGDGNLGCGRLGIRVVNERYISVKDAFNCGCPELKQEILALSEDIKEPYARGVMHVRGKSYNTIVKNMERRKDSHLVVAALIATVTFAAAFTLPGGYKNEEGKNQGAAILSRNSAFQTFVITDAMALVFSVSAVFLYFIMSIVRFKKYIYLSEMGSWFTVAAMGAMVIAFVAGTYAVLAPCLWLAIVVCLVGLSFFLLAFPVGYRMILQLITIDRRLMRKIEKLMGKVRKLKRIIKSIKGHLMWNLAGRTRRVRRKIRSIKDCLCAQTGR